MKTAVGAITIWLALFGAIAVTSLAINRSLDAANESAIRSLAMLEKSRRHLEEIDLRLKKSEVALHIQTD